MAIDWSKGWGKGSTGSGTPFNALSEAAAKVNPNVAAGAQKAFNAAEAIRNDPNSPENIRNQIEDTARRNAEEAVARHEVIKALVQAKSEEIRNSAQMSLSQKLMALGELQDRQSSHYSMTMAKVRNGTRNADPVLARMNQFTKDARGLGFEQQARDAEQRSLKSEYGVRARALGLDDPRTTDPNFNLTDRDRWKLGQQYIDNLGGTVAHDLGIATDTMVSTREQALKDKFTSASKNIPDGGFSGAVSTGMDFLGKVMEPLNLPKELFFEHPYYSAQLAANRGGGFFDVIGSAGAALPGGTFLSNNPDGSQSFSSQNAYYTSTPEKRDELAKGGYIESIGTSASKSPFLARMLQFGGGGIGFFLGKSMAEQLDADPSGIPQVHIPAFLGLNHDKGYDINSSGFYDAFAQVAGDPLTYTPAILGKAAKVGEMAALSARVRAGIEASEGLGKARAVINPMRALEAAGYSAEEIGAISKGGREAFLGGHIGRGIEAAGEKALANFDDAGRLSKALDIPVNVADAAIVTRDAKGLKAGAEVISKAFAEGKFTPSITLRRQALSFLPGVGEGAVGARGVPFVLGNKAVRTNERMVYSTLSYLGRGDGSGLAFRAGEGVTALDHITSRGNRYVREGIWGEGSRSLGENKAGNFTDYWNRHIASDVRGLSAEERFARLGEHKSSVFKAEVDARFKALKSLGPLNMNSRADVEDLLRKLEFTAALVDGKAGASAKRMAIAELQLNTPHAESWKGIMKMSVDSMGMNRRATVAEAELARIELQIPQAEARITEAERMLAAIRDAAPDNMDGLHQYSAELESARKELRSLKKEQRQWKVAADPFRVPDAKEVKALGFGPPRSRAAIKKELAQLDAVLPEVENDLKAGLAFARDSAISQRQKQLDAVQAALGKQPKGSQDPYTRSLVNAKRELKQDIKALEKGNLSTPEMSDIQASLDGLHSKSQVLKPTPMADYEREGFKKRWVFTTDADIHRFERMGEKQLRYEQLRSEQQLERFRLNPIGSPAYDKETGYAGLVGKKGEVTRPVANAQALLTEDAMVAARNFELATEMLSRMGDRSHPLLAKRTDLLTELEDQGHAALEYSSAEISRNIDVRTQEALRTVGIAGTAPLPNTEANRRFLAIRIANIQDEALRGAAEKELARLAEKGEGKSLRTFGAQVEVAIRDQEFATMAGDYARQAKAIGDETVKTFKGAPLGGIFKPFSEPILSILEPVPPTHIRFHSGGTNPLMEMRNRAEDLERVATSLHFDQSTVDHFVKVGVEAKKEQDIYDLLTDMYATYAESQGVDPRVLVSAYKKHATPPERVFSVENVETKKGFLTNKEKLVSADTVTKPQVASQLINDIPVMDPGEVRNLVRQARAADGHVGAKARLAMGAIPNASLPLTGGKVPVKDVFKKTHKFWKFSVVTNAPWALTGFVGGYLTGSDQQDRWSRGLKFGALGALGSVRYLGRVVGVEERLVRYSAVRGLNPLEWVPVIAKAQRRVGVDLPFRLVDDIASTSHPLAHIEGKNLVTVGEDWVVLGQTDSRYIDGLWRVINHHINPETDDLTRMVLQGKLGIIGDETTPWESLAKEWLNTDDGKLLLERMKFAPDGPKSATELLDNYSKFIDGYLPSDDLKRLRLANADLPNATIDHDALKSMLKDDPTLMPKAVYAQDSWYIPKPWKQQRISQTLSQVFGRNILENPTARMNRIPLAEQLYQEEYRSLVLNGVEKNEARNIAEVRAVDRTNKVMFRISDESRFAAKADFVFPFQQPREELARVYFRLVMDNKAHVMQMGELGAKLFNDGKEAGMFYQGNDKEWRLRVPGSAYLSERLGAPADAFEFRVRDAFFFLQGSAAYGTGFDPENNTGDLLQSVIPTPGGPFWTMAYRFAFDHMPGLRDKLRENQWLWDRLFPFGDTGFLTSALSRHAFTAMTGGGVAPWEIANREAAENEVGKYQDLIIKTRQDENLKAGGPANYMPTKEEVRKDMETFFGLWAMMSAVVPAATRPVFAGRDDFMRIQDDYTHRYGKNAFRKLYEDHPEASAIWLNGNQVWRDGKRQPFDDWQSDAEGTPKAYDGASNNSRRYLTYDELFDVWAERKRISSIWTEFYEIQNGYYDSPAEKMMAIEQFKKKAMSENPDFDFNTNYEKVKWLHFILTQADKSQQGALLDAWRQNYNVSPRMYADLKAKALAFESSPYIEARSLDEVRDAVNNAKLTVLNGQDERAWVKQNLSPAEQVKYWQSKMLDMSYYHGGFDSTKYKSALGDALAGAEEGFAGDALEEYRFYKSQMSQVYTDNPDAFRTKKKPSYYNMVTQAITDKYYEQLSASFKEVDQLYDAKQAAYDGKRWTEYKALKGRLADAYERQRALLDNLHNKVADFSVVSEYKDDLLAMMLPTPPDMKEWQKRKILDHATERYNEWGLNGMFIAFGSEAEYQKMTPVIRRAYLDDLTEKLNSNPKDHEGEIHAIRWSYLNEWQKELLRTTMPEETVNAWIAKDEQWDALTAKGKKTYYKKHRSKWHKSYYSKDPAQSALGYAYSLMKQYSKRLPGEKAPAAYAEYIALPKDPATRHAFLRAHPEVSDWIRRGPLANMPSLERAIVSDIMIQYGKWEGEDLDSGAVLELAFAHEQMRKYSLRGDDIAPEAYDAWMAMPSGQEKADYIKAHPEIGEWLRRGPMANMPEEMKSIVRDIMFKYGEWQQNSDPLGELISEMNSMPSYARPQFMREHPELAEYFAASKSPQERAMSETMNAYFALQDSSARAMYLSAHPELKDYFVTARNRNYEKFLNRVAIYMGANPTVFENYLKRQQDTMTELIQRFGQTPFVREVKAGKSEKKSKRASARQM